MEQVLDEKCWTMFYRITEKIIRLSYNTIWSKTVEWKPTEETVAIYAEKKGDIFKIKAAKTQSTKEH
jgi:hypothetical protein